MFDDPKKELKRLQDELLATEDAAWQEKDAGDDLDEELAEIKALLGDDREDARKESFEQFFQEDYKEEYGKEPFYRNYSNGYGAKVRNYANGYGQDMPQTQEFDDAALYMDEFNREDEEEPEPREKGVRGLIVLACLETLGILAVAVWWILWLL